MATIQFENSCTVVLFKALSQDAYVPPFVLDTPEKTYEAARLGSLINHGNTRMKHSHFVQGLKDPIFLYKEAFGKFDFGSIGPNMIITLVGGKVLVAKLEYSKSTGESKKSARLYKIVFSPLVHGYLAVFPSSIGFRLAAFIPSNL